MDRKTIAELATDETVVATDVAQWPQASASVGASARLTLGGAVSRLLPAVQQHVVVAHLRGHVRRLDDLIAVGDRLEARRILSVARHEIAQLPPRGDLGAEVDAIRLILERADDLLNCGQIEA